MTRARKLELLSEAIGEPVTVGTKFGFPVLKIGSREITSGGPEVEERIDVLIRERGLQFEI